MCGIFGIYNINGNYLINEFRFKNSLLKMNHRGPDNNDIKFFENKVVLGHVRLSIIDLGTESNQPFQIDDRYWITYNGEIYNYLEIRNELILEGIKFRTNGDTEVLLRAYLHWGENCVNKFNGMWAFAIYDLVDNKLFCSRDRFGVKPFNYAVFNNQFIFSSEIKSIIDYFPELKVPNYNAISNYCRFSIGAQNQETWFKNVFRLEPSHNLSIINGEINNYRYWKYPSEINYNKSFNEAKQEYLNIFKDAVKIRMRSDVPVGTTLSGGLDSTSIVCAIKELGHQGHQTFTASFEDIDFSKGEKQVYSDNSFEIDEGKAVLEFSKVVPIIPNIISASNSNFVPDLKSLIYHLESGNSSPAVLPLMQVMKEARKKVTVIMEGQGADELLAGYVPDLFVFSLINNFKNLKFREIFISLKYFIKIYSFIYAIIIYFRQLSDKIPIISKIYSMLHKTENIYGAKLSSFNRYPSHPKENEGLTKDPINQRLINRHSGGLVNLLHYGDAISMANSLESRLPFMDYRLVEYCFKLPWYFKLKNATGKFLHREALKNMLPINIYNQQVKIGFNTPISGYFKSDCKLYQKPLEILLSKRAIDRGLFSIDGLREIISKHETGQKDYSTLLFRLLSVELWFRIFIDDESK
jgi:asparagine synthase (glutamine-hydrolysing)